MNDLPRGLDISGPIQAEVFPVWLNGNHLELTGPCGAAPWLIELGEVPDPMATVDRTVRDVVGAPRLLHSTSWRRDRAEVILTFVAAIDGDMVAGMASAPIDRVVLATAEWLEPAAKEVDRT